MTGDAFMPPHEAEMEQAVIGALLVDPTAMAQVADVVRAEDFYRLEHRLVYQTLADMDAEGETADLITAAAWLRRNDRLEDAGGTAYLGQLAQSTTGSANVRAYAEVIAEQARRRELMQAGMQITQIALSEPEPLDRAQQVLMDIGTTAKRGPRTARELMPEFVAALEQRRSRGGDLTGTPTGFYDLDRMTDGMHGGDMIVLAGRPSMGKTTLAMNIAEHVALKQGQGVAVFSMEMQADPLMQRMTASVGRVPLARIRSGQLLDDEWPKATRATTAIANAPLVIDDTPALTPTELRARARRVQQRQGLGLIVADYLQLMQVRQRENRQQEITEISRQLKALAADLGVPVIALSQLNRGLESRPNKRPLMADLRESGAIEQDADLIVFLYRDEVYDDKSPDRGTAEVIVGKQRNGETGTVRLTFEGAYSRFANLDLREWEEIRAARMREQSKQRQGFEDL